MPRRRHVASAPLVPLLIERRYTIEARRTPFRELSARIEAHGEHWHLPLATLDEKKAALRAATLISAVEEHGWSPVLAAEPREITLGIFWSNLPYICTYTTLFSHAGLTTATPRDGLQIALVEPEQSVRSALSEWLDRCSGSACIGAFENFTALLKRSAAVDLLLYNQRVGDLSLDSVLGKLRHRKADVAAFPYGIYADSDTLFSVGALGVPSGYFLQRRAPVRMLDPISGNPTDPAGLHRRICAYVQDLYAAGVRTGVTGDPSELTTREHQIVRCLRQGGTDKEIAATCGLSVWTVHTHLKRIYKKLRATTRTEAVLRYAQK